MKFKKTIKQTIKTVQLTAITTVVGWSLWSHRYKYRIVISIMLWHLLL